MIDNKQVKPLKITNNPVDVAEEIIHSEQSANVLFKFMGKLEYLKDILNNKAIMPRYYEEKLDYLGIENLEKLAFPMSCFCDIHLKKLEAHMDKYGYFGIGLNKEWGIKKGIQPIHYINRYSNLIKDFSHVFSIALKEDIESEDDTNGIYKNYLLSHLFFMKPVDGEMLRDDIYQHRNFHDEKEWRYIPDFSRVETELPQVINGIEQLHQKAYNTYSDGIRHNKELWLDFQLDDIKYILVKDQSDRTALIKFINELAYFEGDLDKYALVSKILVFNEFKEDW